MPKGRPRFNTTTGKPYTPKPTRDYEIRVAMMAMAGGVRFGKGQVRVDLSIFSKKDKADTDNILKSVLDSLQMAQVVENDSQVCEHHVYRIHSSTPRIEVTVAAAVGGTE